MRSFARFFQAIRQTFSERTKLWLLLSIAVICAIGWADEHLRVLAADGNFKEFVYVHDAGSYDGPAQKLSRFAAYPYDILLKIGFAIIFASSLNLVNGHTGQFSLGHAGFMAVGAYVASAVTKGVIFPPNAYPVFKHDDSSIIFILSCAGWVLNLFLNSLTGVLNAAIGAASVLPEVIKFPAALLIGGSTAALMGLLVGVPSLRLRGDYLAIVTLGFNEIIRVLFQNYEPFGTQLGMTNIPPFTTFVSTFVWVAVTIYVIHNLVNSTYGRGFLAVRDDEIAAEAMGINTTRYKVLAFVIAAFFAGIGGGLFAHYNQAISTSGFDFQKSVEIVVIVIIGGMGSIRGVAFAAVLLTIIPEFLRKLGHSDWVKSTTQYFTTDLPLDQQAKVLGRTQEFFGNRMIFFALMLIAVMILRPQGLFGAGVIKKEKKEKKPTAKPTPPGPAITEVPK
jgi:branched-chain amino acid transport system permease protein